MEMDARETHSSAIVVKSVSNGSTVSNIQDILAKTAKVNQESLLMNMQARSYSFALGTKISQRIKKQIHSRILN